MTAQNVPPTKPAGELKIGDWVGEEVTGLTRGHAEIVTVYPFVTDDDRARVLIAYVQAGGRVPYTTGFYADEQVRLLTAAEVAGIREQAERAKRIADIRALADFLEKNLEIPTDPSGARMQVDLRGLDGLRTVRDLGARYGRQPDEHLADRTAVKWAFGDVDLSVIAWHEDGRPAEPKPLISDETIAEAGRLAGAWNEREGRWETSDDKGFDYSRDTEDDPTPVSPARVPLHTGGVVDGGQLVDETEPVH